jgi:four helix bundle protein
MNEDFELYINRNKNINRGYRKLDVWNEAIELFQFVRLKIKLIDSLSFKIKAQIEDSALSVSSNIAEGYARRSLKENIQYISIALASLAENYSQIYALFRTQDIEKLWFEEFDTKHYSLENKLINLNKSYIQKLKNNDEWKNDYILREFIESYEIK